MGKNILMVGDTITISYRYSATDKETFNIKNEQHLKDLLNDIRGEDIYLEAIYRNNICIWKNN